MHNSFECWNLPLNLPGVLGLKQSVDIQQTKLLKSLLQTIPIKSWLEESGHCVHINSIWNFTILCDPQQL